MHLSYNNPSVDYFMDAVQLQVVREEKDLELVVTDFGVIAAYCSNFAPTLSL